MKYSIISAAPAKKFDFAAATEALTDTYLRMSDAYEQIVATEGRIAELETAMDNCDCALRAIEKFGVTATTMNVFNGANDLDEALGLEALDISAVESLGQSVKKVRQEQYTAGLEGKLGEYWKKIVAWLKELWAKIKRWFKELFDRNAKAVRIVSEAQKAGAFKKLANSERKAKLLTSAQVKTALKAAQNILGAIKKISKAETTGDPIGVGFGEAGLTLEGNKIVKTEKFNEVFERKEIDVKSWASEIEAIATEFSKLSTGSYIKEAVKDSDSTFADAIKSAEEAAKSEQATPEQKAKAGQLAKAKKEQASKLTQWFSVYSSLVGLVGNTLVALANIGAGVGK